MAAVRNGVGRETAHEAIKENAVKVALDMRESGGENVLIDQLAADPRLGLTADQLTGVLADPMSFTGDATGQVARVADRVAEVVRRYPDAATYQPGDIL